MEATPKQPSRFIFWGILPVVVLVCYFVGRLFVLGVWNEGIAFSVQFPLWVIYAVNLLLLIGILFWVANTELNVPSQVGAGLVVGGGLANLIDRLIHNGKVWDYIPFGPTGYFNLADVAVSLGLLMLFYYWWRENDTKA